MRFVSIMSHRRTVAIAIAGATSVLVHLGLSGIAAASGSTVTPVAGATTPAWVNGTTVKMHLPPGVPRSAPECTAHATVERRGLRRPLVSSDMAPCP